MISPVSEILQRLLRNKLAGVTGAAFITITSWKPGGEEMPEIDIGDVLGDMDKSIALLMAGSMLNVIDAALQVLNNDNSKEVFLERNSDFVILVPCSNDVLLLVKAQKNGLQGIGFAKQQISKAVKEFQALLVDDEPQVEVTEITPISGNIPENDSIGKWPRAG